MVRDASHTIIMPLAACQVTSTISSPRLVSSSAPPSPPVLQVSSGTALLASAQVLKSLCRAPLASPGTPVSVPVF